jgi:hypothetical protein
VVRISNPWNIVQEVVGKPDLFQNRFILIGQDDLNYPAKFFFRAGPCPLPMVTNTLSAQGSKTCATNTAEFSAKIITTDMIKIFLMKRNVFFFMTLLLTLNIANEKAVRYLIEKTNLGVAS